MKAFIVYWHPEPLSFNHAMLETAQQTLSQAGWEVVTSDLNEMRFNPISDRRNFSTVKDPDYLKLQIEEMHASEVGGFAEDIEAEWRKLDSADLVIWQFPLWWFGLPATFKGWVDRVFSMGRVYGGQKFFDQGVMRNKKAMLSLTTGGPAQAYQPGAFNGDINSILMPIHRGMLRFVGFNVLNPQIVYSPAHLSQDERQAELDRYRERLTQIATEQPITIGHYPSL